MFTNRFFTTLMMVALAAVVALTVRQVVFTPAVSSGLEEAQPYVMDSATRSYIAWGEAMQVRNTIDSGTRSYIAWGEALDAAGKLGDSNTCSNTTQENIFAGIPNNVDSATRSYIARGLAWQAKDIIQACG